MNETWIGCWLVLLLLLPPPGGWLDMEVEGLRDVPGFMEDGKGGRGYSDRPSSKGMRATAAGWATSFGSSIDPRRNQSDAYRRSTTDGDPFLFWFSAANPPANALSHPAGQRSIRTTLTGFPPGRARTTRPPNARDDPGPAAVFGSPLEAPALHARPSLLYTDRPAQSGSRPSQVTYEQQYEERMSPATAVHFIV